MSDLITDEELAHMVSKVWSDFVRGLIAESEFTVQIMEIMINSRGVGNV